MTKICYIWLEFLESERGGAVSHMTGFLSGIKKAGNSFFIISPKRFSYLNKYPVYELGKVSKPIITFLIYYNILKYDKILRTTKQEHPDIIYQRHVGFTYLGARLSKDLKIPLFIEYNGAMAWVTKYWARGWRKYAGKIMTPILEHYEKKTLNSATKIFVVSKVMVDEIRALGVPEEKIIVNPNGVDPKKFTPEISGEKIRKKYGIPKNAVVVGFIGTFGRWHGADVLATAAKEIVQERKDVYFVLMGDGYYKKQAEEAAGNSERIIFTGPVPRDEVPMHLAACDILVNPTAPNPDGTEFFGSPTKLFEYMAMGKAIISSSLGQMKEILEDKKDALLVDAGNYNALKDNILILAENKKLRETLGKNARKKALKKYTWKMNADRVLKAFDEL